jgi:hypothetical protein
MNPMVVAKLALMGAGIVVWGMGVRLDNAMLRWTGVGLIAAAFLLRFAKGRQDN